MNQIVTQELGALVKQADTALVPWAPPRPLVNALAEERRVSYYKVAELANGWGWLYEKYILPAMRNPDRVEEANRHLDAIIEEFDAAVTAVAPVGAKHRRVTEQLEALADTVRTPPRRRPLAVLTGDTLERAKARRRKRIRYRVYSVMKGLQKMRDEAATPAWLKRIYNRAWGQFDSVFDLDPDEKERIRLLATGMLGEATQKAADKLLDPKVAEAFRTLQLKPWAKLQEVQERYVFLMKQRHPDRPGGDKVLAAKINDARDTLGTYYHTLS